MSEAAFYSEVVLDHYRRPRGRGALERCTHAADGANPLCGDALRVELACDGVRVLAFAFSGESCAIATATASMLAELVAGRERAGIDALAERFARLVDGGGEDPALGPLNAMAALHRHPSRHKCALLPWATLRAALAGEARASTEGDPA